MAIALRSSSSVAGGTRTNTTVTAPTGIADNDILVAYFYNALDGGVDAISPPAGWTEWTDRTHSVFNTWYNQVFWKRAASESGNYTFTHASMRSGVACLCFSGAATSGDPIDAAFAHATSAANDTTPDATSITNGQANSMNIVGYSDWNTGITLAAGTSGYTVAVTVDNCGAAYAVQASSGASGSKAFSAAASVQNGTSHWSIKEPSAAATDTTPRPFRFSRKSFMPFRRPA